MIEPTTDGCRCPHCDQYMKLYKRKLNSGMASTLIRIFNWDKKHPDEYLQVKEHLRVKAYHNTHDWTLLRFWGLILPKNNKKDEKGSSGYWKITNKGRDFVIGNINVPTHIFHYNQKFYGYGKSNIDIKGGLGNRFSYAELMGYPEPDVKVKQLQLMLRRRRPDKV